MNRSEALSLLADHIASKHPGHPVRVGIDGVDCAGKTMLANQLAEPLTAGGRTVIRASIDGFHNPREVRYRQGRGSPEGYYEDSFDNEAIISSLLLPLGPGGNLRYRTAIFDFRTDSPVESPVRTAETESILLFDGVFLHRPELLPFWDITVFVDAGFNVTIQRAFRRDRELFESVERTREMYEQRYIPGQLLYLEQQDPKGRADVLFVNSDVNDPWISVRDNGSSGASHDEG